MSLAPRGAVLLLLVGLARATWSDAADEPAARKPVLPDADYPRMVEHAAAVIRTALKDKPDKRSADRARLVAVMLAAYAQDNLASTDGARRVAVRDSALEIGRLVKGKEYAEAVKRLDALAALPADPKGKQERSRVMEGIGADDLMTLFRQPARGGLGIEGRLDDLGEAKNELTAKDLTPQLVVDAYFSAVAGELLLDTLPEEKEKHKQWRGYAQDMRQRGATLAEAAKARDGKAALAALGKLNQTCAECHKAFR